MNPTKAAAVIALIVSLAAGGWLVYEGTVVRERSQAAALACMSCTTAAEAAVANWGYVQSEINLLNAEEKYAEALDFEKKHAGERLVSSSSCADCSVRSPNYSRPSAIAIVGLIASLALFGVAKPTP